MQARLVVDGVAGGVEVDAEAEDLPRGGKIAVAPERHVEQVVDDADVRDARAVGVALEDRRLEPLHLAAQGPVDGQLIDHDAVAAAVPRARNRRVVVAADEDVGAGQGNRDAGLVVLVVQLVPVDPPASAVGVLLDLVEGPERVRVRQLPVQEPLRVPESRGVGKPDLTVPIGDRLGAPPLPHAELRRNVGGEIDQGTGEELCALGGVEAEAHLIEGLAARGDAGIRGVERRERRVLDEPGRRIPRAGRVEARTLGRVRVAADGIALRVAPTTPAGNDGKGTQDEQAGVQGGLHDRLLGIRIHPLNCGRQTRGDTQHFLNSAPRSLKPAPLSSR